MLLSLCIKHNTRQVAVLTVCIGEFLNLKKNNLLTKKVYHLSQTVIFVSLCNLMVKIFEVLKFNYLLFDPADFKDWNIYGLLLQVAKMYGLQKFTVHLRSNLQTNR